MQTNEDVFLTKEVLSKFRSVKEIKRSDDYLNLEKLYRAILYNFKDIVLKLEIYDSLDIVEAFNYAKRMGVFSIDHSFKEQNIANNFYLHNTLGLMSSTIIEGYGCCRNISAFLTDVLKEFGIVSKPVLVKGVYDRMMLSDQQLLAYERCEESLNKAQEKCPFMIPNHVINYVYNNKNSYFVDPSNECIGIPTHNKLISFHRKSGFKFIQEVVYVCNMMYKYASILDILKYKMVRSNITNDDYILIQERIKSVCHKNQDLFESLYEMNRPLYEEYINGLNKIKILIETN